MFIPLKSSFTWYEQSIVYYNTMYSTFSFKILSFNTPSCTMAICTGLTTTVICIGTTMMAIRPENNECDSGMHWNDYGSDMHWIDCNSYIH